MATIYETVTPTLAITPTKQRLLGDITNQVSGEKTPPAVKVLIDTYESIPASVLARNTANHQALLGQNKHAKLKDKASQLGCEYEDAHFRALNKRSANKKTSASSSVKANNKHKKVPCHIRKKQEAAAAKAHSAAMARTSNKKQTSKDRKAKRLAKEQICGDFLLRPLSASCDFDGSPVKTAGCSASPLPESEVSIRGSSVLSRRTQRFVNMELSVEDAAACVTVQPALPALPAIPQHENTYAVLAEGTEEVPVAEPSVDNGAEKRSRRGLFMRGVCFVGGLLVCGAVGVYNFAKGVAKRAMGIDLRVELLL